MNKRRRFKAKAARRKRREFMLLPRGVRRFIEQEVALAMRGTWPEGAPPPRGLLSMDTYTTNYTEIAGP